MPNAYSTYERERQRSTYTGEHQPLATAAEPSQQLLFLLFWKPKKIIFVQLTEVSQTKSDYYANLVLKYDGSKVSRMYLPFEIFSLEEIE